jgi:signal transduction histidine kinase
MKKVALVFVIAVAAPSLVLAWLALRSLRDHQLVMERQQTLFYQGVAEAMANQVQNHLADQQRDFAQQVESFFGRNTPGDVAAQFDDFLCKSWRPAEVGFVVSLDGKVLAPSLSGRKEARQFRVDNDKFLCSRESVEVYWNSPKGQINLSRLDEKPAVEMKEPVGKEGVFATKKGGPSKRDEDAKTASGEARFRQLIGDSNEGTLARFLQDQLKLLFWYRSQRDQSLVFGAQVNLAELASELRESIVVESRMHDDICVALLDDGGRPFALSHPDFIPGLPPLGGVIRILPSQSSSSWRGQNRNIFDIQFPIPAPGPATGKTIHPPDWKRPFVAAEIGEVLPHWEVAVYLLNPAKVGQAAASARFTVGLLVGLLVLAIAVGSWLIVVDLRRQLTLARQQTDFVSNVSHELKTPLTSIRMFSEMLAEGRVQEEEKRRRFLGIITAETARLTRLINNVLDFARLERGEKKYDFAPCDFAALARETVESYRPHLEAAGFTLRTMLPSVPLPIRGDRDALAQIVVNLLSNAEKYSGERREIDVELAAEGDGAELRVLDRGLGVPRGCEENIFEQFFRAHDSLGSGIQGSGLGLTLARQIARAHGGDVVYRAREGGGSCFALRLPASKT